MSNPDFDSPEQQYEVLFERQVRARTEELSAALEKLSEESMRFRQLAEHIQGVFYLTDADNREMLYVSPAYEAIWGRSRESLYANPRSWADAILPEDRERVRAALEKVIARPAQQRLPLRTGGPANGLDGLDAERLDDGLDQRSICTDPRTVTATSVRPPSRGTGAASAGTLRAWAR